MKLGGLKEKVQPKHGKVIRPDAASKFAQMPLSGRGEQPAERGKIRHPAGSMSARDAIGNLVKEFKATAPKRGKQIPVDPRDAMSSNKAVKVGDR